MEGLRESFTADDETAAGLLAAHAREMCAPDLCAGHGLPLFHTEGLQCESGVFSRVPMRENQAGVRVADVRRLVNLIDGLRDAVESQQRQRHAETGQDERKLADLRQRR